VSLSHSLGFGGINWIGNYREGLSASIGNSNTLYFNPYDYSISLSADMTFHHRFSFLFGISSRLQYRHWFNGLSSGATGAIRGFPTNDYRAEYMLSLNLDFPFRILRFAPSEWFDNPKLRIMDFEMHLSPFIDIAFMEGEQKPFPNKRSFTDGLFGSGLEIIIFPDFFRSLYLRISAGYSMNNLYETGKLPKWDELFIGIGHHY
jgi:hypothetical protein